MHGGLLIVASLLTLGTAGCGGGDTNDVGEELAFPANVLLGQEYLLGFGESVRFGTLRLEFTTLAEDGRCPYNASCIWEGNARILLTAERGGATTVLELNTHPHYSTSATFEGYVIELRHLSPDPWMPRPAADRYVATLFVDYATP